MKTPNPDMPDFLKNVFGSKQKVENLTEPQKLGKKLLEIAKQHSKN